MANEEGGHYSLKQVTLQVWGRSITGFGEGEGVIDLKREAELFDHVKGAMGDVVRCQICDKSAVAEIKLLSTSKANATLQAMSDADQANPDGSEIGSFLLRDRINNDEYAGEECWIKKLPDRSMGLQPGESTWHVFIPDCEFHPGGRATST